MPLRDDILNPIPGDNPSGENLRYAPVYDKIKEARRQDDDAPQGQWQTARKTADFKLVIKLAGEAVATKSKDLQLAAWLTEALLNTEGFPGLNSGLTLVRGLIDNFWDTLYPELEDGEAEFRAAPLDWLGGTYLVVPLKKIPLAKAGHGFLKYHEAKAVGYEADASSDSSRQEAFSEAVAEGKLTLDDWDKAFNATSKPFYKQIVADADACLQTLEELQPVCEEKFGEFAPSWSKLRDGIAEVRHLAWQLLEKKRETDPDPEDAAAAPLEEVPDEPVAEEPAFAVSSGGAAAQPARIARRAAAGAEPADREDAIARVAAAAAFWRKDDPNSPAPYLLLRGMRWGELRASSSLDPSLFEAPPTGVRQNLKRLLGEGAYAEVIELAENAMAMPCGRAWLDLQRYAVAALEGQGYYPIAEAIRAEVKSLVRDFPDLADAMLLDDTPAANKETQEWIRGFAESAAYAPVPSWSSATEQPAGDSGADSAEPPPPDTYALAIESARSGRVAEAIEMLTDDASRQNSGRGRFERRLQLARICLSTGHEEIAYSILEELASVIDRHDLEAWEAPDVVAGALALLYGCLKRGEEDAERKRKLYARICRLDPVQALAAAR